MFSATTYSKGASIVKMMFHVIGGEAWRDFMASFVAKHQFGKVDTFDFFDDMENSLHSNHELMSIRMKNRNFTEIFLPWLIHKGVPAVHIRKGSIYYLGFRVDGATTFLST